MELWEPQAKRGLIDFKIKGILDTGEGKETSLFIDKQAEKNKVIIIRVGRGHIQCSWEGGRDRATEAPASLRGENYGWVNKARKKHIDFLLSFLQEKTKQNNSKSFICLNDGPWKGWARPASCGQGQHRGTRQGSLQGPCTGLCAANVHSH